MSACCEEDQKVDKKIVMVAKIVTLREYHIYASQVTNYFSQHADMIRFCPSGGSSGGGGGGGGGGVFP